MGEVRTLVVGQQVNYSGLFRLDEFFGIIKRFLDERGYFTTENRTQEDVFEAGKHTLQELQAIKPFNDYALGKFRFSIEVKNLKDQTVQINGHKQKYQQGQVTVTVNTDLETDYRSKWEDRGWQFFFRTISDKFIRHDYTHVMEETLKKDTADFAAEMKSYLNMVRFKIQSGPQPPQKA